MASQQSQQKAAKEATRARNLEKQRNDLEAAIARREFVREARIRNAAAVVSTENQGVANTSLAQGAQSSFMSGVNSGLSFLDTSYRINDQISTHLGKQAKATANAETLDSLSKLAFYGASNLPMKKGK